MQGAWRVDEGSSSSSSSHWRSLSHAVTNPDDDRSEAQAFEDLELSGRLWLLLGNRVASITLVLSMITLLRYAILIFIWRGYYLRRYHRAVRTGEDSLKTARRTASEQRSSSRKLLNGSGTHLTGSSKQLALRRQGATRSLSRARSLSPPASPPDLSSSPVPHERDVDAVVECSECALPPPAVFIGGASPPRDPRNPRSAWQKAKKVTTAVAVVNEAKRRSAWRKAYDALDADALLAAAKEEEEEEEEEMQLEEEQRRKEDERSKEQAATSSALTAAGAPSHPLERPRRPRSLERARSWQDKRGKTTAAGFKRLPTALMYPNSEVAVFTIFSFGLVQQSAAVLGAYIGRGPDAIDGGLVALGMLTLLVLLLFYGSQAVELFKFARLHRHHCWIASKAPTKLSEVEDPLLSLLCWARLMRPRIRRQGVYMTPENDDGMNEPRRTIDAIKRSFFLCEKICWCSPLKVFSVCNCGKGAGSSNERAWMKRVRSARLKRGETAGRALETLGVWLGKDATGTWLGIYYRFGLVLIQVAVCATVGFLSTHPFGRTPQGAVVKCSALIGILGFGVFFAAAGSTNDLFAGWTTSLVFLIEAASLCAMLESTMYSNKLPDASGEHHDNLLRSTLFLASVSARLLSVSVYLPLTTIGYDMLIVPVVKRVWAAKPRNACEALIAIIKAVLAMPRVFVHFVVAKLISLAEWLWAVCKLLARNASRCLRHTYVEMGYARRWAFQQMRPETKPSSRRAQRHAERAESRASRRAASAPHSAPHSTGSHSTARLTSHSKVAHSQVERSKVERSKPSSMESPGILGSLNSHALVSIVPPSRVGPHASPHLSSHAVSHEGRNERGAGGDRGGEGKARDRSREHGRASHSRAELVGTPPSRLLSVPCRQLQHSSRGRGHREGDSNRRPPASETCPRLGASPLLVRDDINTARQDAAAALRARRAKIRTAPHLAAGASDALRWATAVAPYDGFADEKPLPDSRSSHRSKHILGELLATETMQTVVAARLTEGFAASIVQLTRGHCDMPWGLTMRLDGNGCWTIWEMAPGGVAERADEDLLPGDRILDANGRQMCSQVVREEIVHSDLLGLELGVVRNEQVRQTRGRRQRLSAPSTPIGSPRTLQQQGLFSRGALPDDTPSVSSED